MLTRSALVSLFALTSSVSAGKGHTSSEGTLFHLRQFLHRASRWSSLLLASNSSSTRERLTCPFNWGMHKTAGCCIPEKEVSPCDCGEGYTFNAFEKKCKPNPSGGCGKDQWYHDRSGSCCDNSWGWMPPPEAPCPKGITCPKGWFWHKEWNQCTPLTPRSPEPACDNWDEKNQCCGGQTGPSQGVGGGKGGKGNQGGWGNPGGWGQGGNNGGWGQGGHNGGWGNQKRNLKAREQIALFPQSDLDKMYCPGFLHACTVPTATGGEWAYECVDFATELESCGGCASTGEGADCTQIPHALGVGCESGVCTVYTCQSGFAANGTACVAI
ncbi:hypothetical protein IAR55_004347 [Kwoniella newhampshirensis]|uniref:Protein CPL1-like domain-containing protein n=1 Tax=Kwoniella newhampshirensis TaxID=1651941 RepID=A0AAW0YJF0_9TREE